MENGITVGMDMGDKSHIVCVLDAQGNVLKRGTVTNTASAIRKYFGKMTPCRVAMEAGTHSGWVSRIIEGLGHEVLVGNPRKLRVIWDSDEKNDYRDAEMLARIARFDPQLLYPIHHRSAETYADLAVIKARDMLVKARAMLITHVRGTVKSVGARISTCGADVFHRRLIEEMPSELRPALEPIMKSLEDLTCRIRHCDNLIEALAAAKYPQTEGLRAISGVGPVTSLAYVLTLEDSSRFDKSRSIGPFLGMTPKRDQSGQIDKQLGITKAGDTYLRTLLVGCAQYILGAFGPDCDLRRFGLKLASRGGKNAKRRAVVAVARKLAVMMHHLWKSGEAYDPLYQQNHKQKKAA
jgi:transposase